MIFKEKYEDIIPFFPQSFYTLGDADLAGKITHTVNRQNSSLI
jgi:hypothetical protein